MATLLGRFAQANGGESLPRILTSRVQEEEGVILMGRTAKVFFVGIMVLSSSVFIWPALAATSGNDLLRFCTSVPDSTEQSFCLGYLHGVVDGSMAVRISEGRPPIFALPAGADILQIRDVVVKFLKEN